MPYTLHSTPFISLYPKVYVLDRVWFLRRSKKTLSNEDVSLKHSDDAVNCSKAVHPEFRLKQKIWTV